MVIHTCFIWSRSSSEEPQIDFKALSVGDLPFECVDDKGMSFSSRRLLYSSVKSCVHLNVGHSGRER
eukprot:scaffold49092_cov37-Attheya_sp.AAC.1